MQLSAETRVTRDEASVHLKAMGFIISPKTLANLATQGKGPPYQLFGRRTLYLWRDLITWAEGRLSEPRHSTAEHDLRAA